MELAEERNLAQASASETNSIQINSGDATDLGVDKISRAHPEFRLAEELHSCRSKSGDLVDSVFGSLIGIDDAAKILRELLQMFVLTVQKEVEGKYKAVEEAGWSIACEHAGTHAEHATQSKSTLPDEYRWKWTIDTNASETAAAMFLNVVAIAAHAAALRLGKGRDHPHLRFITAPNPHRAVPLSNEPVAQDRRPDILAFEYSAFSPKPKADALDRNRYCLLPSCSFKYIETNLPQVLDFTPQQRSAHSQAIADFLGWFKSQATRDHLDLWRFCWPEVQLTGEAMLSNLQNALLEQYVYMRQQRRTQPWMRWIIGLVVTTSEIGLIRADTLGVEQCTFGKNSSRGALDVIRICLGLVRSKHADRGQHEGFVLFDTTSVGPPHIQSPSADSDGFGTGEPKVKYTHRTVRFINLRGDKLHYPPDDAAKDVTFYVHHFMHDNGSLVGRCPRIFCVSREVAGPKGEVPTRLFVGPYVLKVYYADHTSECYCDDLIAVARSAQVQKVLLPYTSMALRSEGVIPSVVSNREEVFAQSDMKRMLVQCSRYEEFGRAFIDFVEGIASLAEHDLVHRDLSIGNVLLSQETPCPPAFLSDAAASVLALTGTPAVFTQRALDQRIGGVLHDMDMAGRLPPAPKTIPVDNDWLKNRLKNGSTPSILKSPAEQDDGLLKGFRTGTLPFMAISLLFVMFLFFESHPDFDNSPLTAVPATGRPWAKKVLRWANRLVPYTLREQAALKRSFFAQPNILQEAFARETDLWYKNEAYVDFFFALYVWPTPLVVLQRHDQARQRAGCGRASTTTLQRLSPSDPFPALRALAHQSMVHAAMVRSAHQRKIGDLPAPVPRVRPNQNTATAAFTPFQLTAYPRQVTTGIHRAPQALRRETVPLRRKHQEDHEHSPALDQAP
ncbi:hypothetical protein DFH09DRAFT_1307372 [Mycena vulgaris]|nr:hypothetical protein DFH09DRAFT_1307372 [Mycena vulgaris]